MLFRSFKPVDITSAGLPTGPEEDLDPEEDAWERGAPPPKGCYPFRLGFQNKPEWEQGNSRNNTVYFRTTLACRIAQGEHEGAVAFLRLSTFIRAGKSISTAAGLLKKCGYKVPARVTHLALARLVTKVVNQVPLLWMDGD